MKGLLREYRSMSAGDWAQWALMACLNLGILLFILWMSSPRMLLNV